ncbi:MAG: hypothetical protein C5B52_01710 [Bacteroidetes bacterium]|nr:MAG: hypothetical protein C5B52_01710 [Bacteroidota bacterium]
MANSKKPADIKSGSPQRTGLNYSLKGKDIPIYSFAENEIIDGEAYLPLFSEKRIKGRALVLRREDLLPKAFIKEAALVNAHIFGYTLYDTFKPTYGDSTSNNARRFSFEFSKCLFTTNVSWLMSNRLERPGEFFQGLIFTINTAGIPNPHLRINFGATRENGIPDSILTVITSLGSFKINVSPLAAKSLSIILNGPMDTLSLAFRQDENDPRAYCEIYSCDLYDTIFVDPFPLSDGN